ncbi:MAG: OmpW family protein [Kordiimonadaceae bacterium]|nr:OmpW family protein [Kordiimonadaceae bacterium]
MSRNSVLRVAVCAALLQLGTIAVTAGDSPWLVRLRVIDVSPDVSSTTSIGGAATVESSWVPELDITYFWTDHVATELILATSKHTMGAVGTGLGDLNLGHVWVLPPTLLLQYHPNPNGQIRPYIGAGINYTIFYSADSAGFNSIDYSNSFGVAFQGGIDIGINDHWAFNVDVKKIYIQSDVSINGGAVTAAADINPWVFGAGLAYRF